MKKESSYPHKVIARIYIAILLMAMSALPFPALAEAHSALPNLGDTARSALSPIEEQKLGDRIMLRIRQDRDYLGDAMVIEYLDKMGNDMLASYPEARGETGRDFSFFVVRDKTINAFALPGGYIGFHSALLLIAKRESELASVMAHEIGHVAQRHIARMLGNQEQDMLIPIAAAVLAAAAASSGGGDASAAIMAGGIGLSAQRQLNFSREAEREADRIGFKILNEAKYDASGMAVFFGRMQNAARAYDDSLPSYLRTHPMTTERIADIRARIDQSPPNQHVDHLNFSLVQARVRVLQDLSTEGLVQVMRTLKKQVKSTEPKQVAAGYYGLALVAYHRKEYALSAKLLKYARKVMKDAEKVSKNKLFANLAIELHLANKAYAQAEKASAVTRARFPESEGLAMQYARILYAAGKLQETEDYLRDQLFEHREKANWQRMIASVYAKQGKNALMHAAMAEAYGLEGSLSSALEQLNLARRIPNASFYDLAIIDAREKYWREIRREQLLERDK